MPILTEGNPMAIYRGDMNILKTEYKFINLFYLMLYHRLKEQEGRYVTSVIQLTRLTF